MSDLNKREDAISKEQFREQMYHRCFEVDNDPNMQKWESGNWIRWKLFEEELDKAPIIMPSRLQGKWKPKNHHTDYCSNCGFEETRWRTVDYNFCPLCGIRMKGVDDE